MCPPFIQQKWNKCWENVGQTGWTDCPNGLNAIYHFRGKENVEAMLNESLNQPKFDSTRLQEPFFTL